MTTHSTAHPSLHDVLRLDRTEEDRFRSRLVYPDEKPLYGGQIAAQALVAAGRTVGEDRSPNSLHLYYLRSGTASRATEFRVQRDRDGRTFSARRVVAVQDGKVIATASCSFGVAASGPDIQAASAPEVPGDPEDFPVYPAPRMFGLDCRLPPGPRSAEWPTRFWARAVDAPVGDGLMRAATLTYLSDRSNGLGGLDLPVPVIPASLDHAIWFHRRVDPADWMLMDLVPHTLSAERMWYTGTIHDRSGALAASLAQELLTRPRAPRTS
ncbi:acyl-CoA thioesterase [Streptomyces sp. NPDC090075]|uniref:acyl-CoA thioesterase n=1 Tax=Streptomyces sp. NPDC090075 TaxID=3365937 RepID=UPI0037F1947E